METAETYLKQGDAFRAEGKWKEALQCYQAAINLSQDKSGLYHKLGDFLLDIEYYEKAIEAYLNNIKFEPEFSWSHYNLGVAFYQTGKWQESFNCYNKVTELDSKFWEFNSVDFHIQQKLGDFLLEQKSWKEATVCYQRAIALNVNYPWSFTNLARALYQLGETEEAVASVRQAIEVKPDFDWGYFYLGEILSDLGEKNEAITAYHRALELNPELQEVYQRLEKLRGDRQQESLEIVADKSSNPEKQTSQQDIDLDLVIQIEKAAVKAIHITNKKLLFYISTDLEIQLDAQVRWEGCDSSHICFLEKVKAEAINQYLLVISSDQLDKQETLTKLIIISNDRQLLVEEIYIHPSAELAVFLEPISADWSQEQFLCFLVRLRESIASFLVPEIHKLMGQLRDQLENSSKIQLEYGCWLSPSMIYLEASVQERWIFGKTKVLLLSNQGCAVAQGYFFQISHNQLAGVAIAHQDVYTVPYDLHTLTIFDNEKPIVVEGGIFEKAYSLEFVNRLNSKPEYQKHLIRESTCWGIIEQIPKNLQPEAENLLYKLQSFVNVPPVSLIDPNLPFNIFIDQAIPIQSQGLFIHGWMHDPYNSLEKIEVISALGFSMFIDESKIYKLERQDVREYIQTTRYANFDAQLGFCAYIQVPEEIRQKFESFAELHSFRFKIKLKGGIELEIVPDTKYHDVFSARQTVVKIAPANQVSDDMLEHCIGPAAAALQQLCIAQVTAKEVNIIGKPVQNPKVSIIIPLYKQLDFMKVQFATLAHDPFTQNCEVIYVLDSPAQETEVKNFLIEHSALYQIPVKLVVMNRNSGYAMANNIGVKYAEGQYLVLMNSDVFPKTIGWAEKMVAFYETSSKIGAVAPKLIYEDDSLQHAGMFFEKTTFPFWITLHSCKGFSNHYPAAQNNRKVPAVTGACLMIEKALYEQVGGYSTDYVIGDFEDSDLCLKCGELGYESWYFAEAELYHLERQSVPQSPVYSGSVVWRYNAQLHQQRWGDKIERIMQTFTNN